MLRLFSQTTRLVAVLLATCSVAETLLEAIDSTSCVYDLLLACVERVALRTNVQVNVFALSRSSLNNVTAAASCCNFFIFRMDVSLHSTYLPWKKCAILPERRSFARGDLAASAPPLGQA